MHEIENGEADALAARSPSYGITVSTVIPASEIFKASSKGTKDAPSEERRCVVQKS